MTTNRIRLQGSTLFTSDGRILGWGPAVALGRAQAARPCPGEVGQAEHDRVSARNAAGGYDAK